MNYEIKDCIDAGTEYCPCSLAETGDCILCSQLQGKDFCDCINWKGVCIFQEYDWNNNKAKTLRKVSLATIIEKEILNEDLVCFTILCTHKLVQELSIPDSFIFVRNPRSNSYFDSPISIMETLPEENLVKIVIELKGVKTKNINLLEKNDNMAIKGPYWNGVLGLKNLDKCKDGVSLLIARGIGMAPMIPVMRKLYANGNKIIALIDRSNYKDIFIKKYLEMCNADVIECNILSNGNLSSEAKNIIKQYENKVNLIYCSVTDILISKILEFANDDANFACCNNAKMCCGEGVCGACSVRYAGHNMKKMCKVQIDPRYIFKGRRLL